MSDPLPTPVAPVSLVIKRDGRQVPFEADKISRALFAAGEELGRADAFLCRELTDGVLHFIGQEFAGQMPTTSAIADLVVKVVREFGHPALAQQFLTGKAPSPERTHQRTRTWGLKQVDWLARRMSARLATTVPNPKAALEDYLAAHFAMSQVYAPDLLAAQADGLIHFGGHRSVQRLTATVVPHHSDPLDLVESMAAYRRATGDALILEGPDRRLWSTGAREPTAFAPWCRAFHLGLGDQGCRAIVNLHRQAGSGEFAEPFSGPLFAPSSATPAYHELSQCSLELCDELLKRDQARVRIDWHLAEADFADENQGLLSALVQRATAGQPFCFVFDRPRRQPRLAEGISASHNAALLTVGLHLSQLARQMGQPKSPERFLTKLVSLVRLALSAATQKRNALRRLKEDQPILARGFFLEKARLVLAPIGLDAVVGDLLSEFCCSRNPAPLAFACQILERIRATVHEDGQALLLDACIDSPLIDDAFASPLDDPENLTDREHRAGVTIWDDEAPLLRQIAACGSLHDASRGGTALIRYAPTTSVDELVQALRHAWYKTNLLALRFVTNVRA
ncbi:MAG TPA: ATP cone domain-containing protein [Gemmataceae bacterium]|jgi:hypothetical protein|nr:ATP cone domain-containing protein [Gemmataceae bacterium]